MADLNLGDVTARLRLDSADFLRGLTDARQALVQFGQAKDQIIQNLQRFQQASQQTQQTNQRFQQTLNQTNQTFNQTSQTINQANQTFNTFNQTLNTVTTTTNTARQAAQAATTGWREMLAVAGGIGIATSIQGLVRAMVDFGKAVVETATKMESIRNSLSALAGSSAAGQQQFQQLFATAQQLGVAFEPLVRGWRQLTAAATLAGLPLEDQRRLMVALTTEARRVGASNEELGRAITAVAQMASKGKVSMEELRQQLGEALPTAMGAAAKGMGITTDALDKLISTGTVGFASFARALSRGFEQLQQGSGQMADGAQQAFNRLGNAFTAFKNALGQNILPEMERFARWSQTILETATKLLNITGGRAGGGPQGPSVAEMAPAGTANQQQELARVNQAITRLERERQRMETLESMSPQGGDRLTQDRAENEERLTRARAVRDQILEGIRATQGQADAQEKVTAETNKTKAAQEQTADAVKDITKALDDIRKAEEAFKREAAAAPSLYGRPTGTPEEQERYLQERQSRLRPQVEAITKTITTLPPGVTLPADLEREVRAYDTAYGQIGKSIDTLKEKEQARREAERKAAQEAAQAIREMKQEQERLAREEEAAAQKELQQLREIVKERENQWEQLQKLADTYTEKKPKTDADTAAEIADTLATTEHAEAARRLAEMVAATAQALATVPERRAEAARSFAEFETLRDLRQRAEDQYEADTTPAAFGESPQTAQGFRRARRTVTSEAGTEQLDALHAQQIAQDRLNYGIQLFGQLSDSVGQAWTQALSGIADHTKTVSEAFREMARSILQSMAQIASQEAFRALFRVGAGLLTQAALGGGGIGPAAGAGGGYETYTPAPQLFAQGGAIVNKPTTIIAGENMAMNPEMVLNRPQIQGLFAAAIRAAPSAGGQATGGQPISIINFTSNNRPQAEQAAAQERAQGKQAILNEVLSDLSRGESSSIGRMIRTISR